LLNYNYNDINEKGFLRMLKDALLHDALNKYFGDYYNNYCDEKSIQTLKNLFYLFTKKNEIVINSIFFDFEELNENIFYLDEAEKQKKEKKEKTIIQSKEQIIKNIYFEVDGILEEEIFLEKSLTKNNNEK